MQVYNSPELWIKDLPVVKDYMNKYDRGHVVIIGASILSGSTGASKLAAMAALRTGAGLVSIISDKETAPIYATSMTSVMVKITPGRQEQQHYFKDHKINSILLGAGAGVHKKTKQDVMDALISGKNLVIDADGLSVFHNNPMELFSAIKNEVVLTPHLGEFKRLFMFSEDRIASAINAAALSKAIIILKGYDTIIAAPNGKYVINKAAPVSLATAGSGDVLAGIIVSLMAQGVEVFKASCIACYIHSEAARLFGAAGLIAEDLISQIPKVLNRLQNKLYRK